MKVLFLEWNSYCIQDIKDAHRDLGNEVISFPFFPKQFRNDPEYEKNLKDKIAECSPDYVFTFNYYPVVSQVCNRENVPYIAWIYDSPFIPLYSYTTIFPCNHIFVFDKELCYEFQKNGIKTVHYLPLAANVSRLDALPDPVTFLQSPNTNKTDITFVGSLYTEKGKSGFYNQFKNLPEYTQGYLDGIIAAQKKVFGYNFIQEMLTPNIMKSLKESCYIEANADGVESEEYIFSDYFINRHITAIERKELIQEIASRFPMDIYTSTEDFSCPNTTVHGPIDYYTIAPYVYRTSRINLNISLRSIKSGMPLRIFDIMGSGGFLLSNYQADFLDYFIPGEDFDFYDSQSDLLTKIDYYLKHEDERAAIAISGHDKIKQYHLFTHRVQEMESYLS